jgi:hypothetical protein
MKKFHYTGFVVIATLPCLFFLKNSNWLCQLPYQCNKMPCNQTNFEVTWTKTDRNNICVVFHTSHLWIMPFCVKRHFFVYETSFQDKVMLNIIIPGLLVLQCIYVILSPLLTSPQLFTSKYHSFTWSECILADCSDDIKRNKWTLIYLLITL